MQIVLHSDDIILLEYWEKAIKQNCILIDDLEELKKIEGSLIIVNYSAFNSEAKSVLNELVKSNRVLVLHRTPDINTAKYILALGAKGYGNALMREHFIVSAVETIKDKMIWLYPEFTSLLIKELAFKFENSNLSKLDVLSKREKEVALLLKDGLIYKEIAQKLNITSRTVKAHASHIYKKFDEMLSLSENSNLEFTYIGNIPKDVNFKNIIVNRHSQL